MKSTVVGLSVGIARGGNAKIGEPLSSGACRLVVSLIGEGIGEGSHFGVF